MTNLTQWNWTCLEHNIYSQYYYQEILVNSSLMYFERDVPSKGLDQELVSRIVELNWQG